MIKILTGVVVAVLSAQPLMAQTANIFTTQPGSLGNSVAAAVASVASVVSDHSDLRVLVTPQASEGHSEVNEGLGDFGVGPFVGAYHDGNPLYAKYPHENLRAVAVMMPLRSVIYVRKDAPYQTFADLKGTRMYCDFAAQDAATALMKAYLINDGMTAEDVDCLPTQNVVTAADGFASQKADSFVFAVGAAKAQEVAAAVGGLRPLPFTLNEAHREDLDAILPGAYAPIEQPAPFKVGFTDPIPVLAWSLYLFTNKDVPDEVVKTVVATLHDNKPALVSVFGALAAFDPDKMGQATEKTVIFHPGAVAYYEGR